MASAPDYPDPFLGPGNRPVEEEARQSLQALQSRIQLGIPPGNWRFKSQPPLLGRAPASIRDMILAPQNPATRFTGPILSGEKGHVAIGSAMLQLPLWVDYTMGNFSLPIQFEPASMLIWIVQMAYADFNGSQSTSVALGTNQDGVQIAVPDGFLPMHQIGIRQCTGTLPFAIDPNPFECWVTVNNYGATAGSGVVLIGYARV